MLLALLLAMPQTIYVSPFFAQGNDASWAGVAAAESVIDAVVQANHDNFLTLADLDEVLRHRDLRVEDPAVPARALELGRALGATQIVVGEVSRDGAGFRVVARRIRVSDGKTAKTARARGPLAAAALRAGRELLGQDNVGVALSKSETALRQATRCELALLRQPLGVHARPMLSREAVAEARKSCSAAVEADPELGLARAGLAIVLALDGDLTQAQSQAETARKDRFVPLASLAEAFSVAMGKDVEEWRDTLEAALAERPGFLRALASLAEERVEDGDDEEAVELFDRYLRRAPRTPWAMARKARELARMKQFDEAIELSENALRMDPNDPELSIETASRYIDAGRDAKAQPLLQRAAAASPPRALALLRLGYLEFRAHRLNEARAALERSLTLAHRDDEWHTRAKAHADLARVAAKQNRYADAVSELQRSRKEGYLKLPCQEPELARWMDRPELVRICLEASAAQAEEHKVAVLPVTF